MTHHLTGSSISRRNRSRTTPQLSVQPAPIRVKRGARFRVRRPTQLQQYQDDQRYRRASWHPEHSLQTPEDKCEPFSSILEEPADNHHPLPHQHQDLYRFQSPTPTSTSDYSSLSVVTTPPTQHGFRSASESDLLSRYPSNTNADSLEGDFSWTQSPESELPRAPQSQELQDMSSLGFMLPAHFASLEPFPPAMESASLLMEPPNSHYISSSSSQQVLPTPASAASSAYLPSFSSSPAMLGSSPAIPERRHSSSRSEHPVIPSYQRSPYQASQPSAYQPPLSSSYQSNPSSLRTSPAPLSYGQSSGETAPAILTATVQPSGYSTIQSNLSTQSLGALSYGSYPPPPPYGSSYDLSSYHSSPQPLYPPSTASSYPPPYLSASLPDGSSATSNGSSTTVDGRNVRVVHQRPKPQCWDHGCNGRQFSTFSNLLRHQREKSGTAGKSYCPRCGAEFTRTTAMKGHMNNDKCKPRRSSGASETTAPA